MHTSRKGVMAAMAALGRAFGGLKVRYKLMILHNLFFVVLAASVWFTLIPQISLSAERALQREIALVGQLLTTSDRLRVGSALALYEYREGSAAELAVPSDVRRTLDANPGVVQVVPGRPGFLYAKDAARDVYRRLSLPDLPYDSLVRRAKITLLVVLGVVYCLAVLVLELTLMRTYVHRPLRTLLEADEASRHGDIEHELIDEGAIQNDELGRLMRSRNATVRQLRENEQDLRRALHQLQEFAEDLRKKNYLLETAKENIAAQDRLASLGLLSAGVAHELNTPLAVLRGSIEKLAEATEDPHAQERLQRMLRVTRRLQTISESLVDFARVRTERVEHVPIRPLIDESWELVAIDEKAAGVHFANRTGEADQVLGNSDRLGQLFVNLLRNALHAIRVGGQIQVRSWRQWQDGREWVVVAVEDDGPGIPPGVLPDIFEAFVTTRLDARGTGLGLTVAEGIAHQHGGAIAAGNRPGGGARLEVRLPAEPAVVSGNSLPGSAASSQEGIE